MFDKFFEKYSAYRIVEKPQPDHVEKYRGRLPDAILSLWSKYGWGIFMDDYLRLVNPEEFEDFTKSYIENIGGTYTPWAVTVFGDLLVWHQADSGQVEFYNYRYKDFEVISSQTGIENLFNRRLSDSYFNEKIFRKPINFSELKAKLGIPAYDQCYGYFPLLALGGSESVDHVQIVDLRVHMDLMAQASGPL